MYTAVYATNLTTVVVMLQGGQINYMKMSFIAIKFQE